MATWALAEAKARFSQVVDDAVHKEPQQITRNGKLVAVLVSCEQWQQSQPNPMPRKNLADFFRESPLVGSGIDLRRGKDKARSISL